MKLVFGERLQLRLAPESASVPGADTARVERLHDVEDVLSNPAAIREVERGVVRGGGHGGRIGAAREGHRQTRGKRNREVRRRRHDAAALDKTPDDDDQTQDRGAPRPRGNPR
jgi:hypothetical protein